MAKRLVYGDELITEQRVWRFAKAMSKNGSKEWADIAIQALEGDPRARREIVILISESYFEAFE